MKVVVTGFSCLMLSALFVSQASASFLPPNKLHLEDNINKAANMTQAEFDAIINKVSSVYNPIVAAQGAKLVINHLWTDTTVNANASQQGNVWNVNMYGGLARRSEVTPDGFQAVVCHELGHHLAGFAFYGDNDWAANEGQADYFATHACLPNIWRADLADNSKFRANVDPTAKRACDGAWPTEAEQNLCYRISDASRSLATLLAALNNNPAPRFDTPDTNQVGTTDSAHPAAQCRLDTYLAGAVCVRPFNDAVIPAKGAAGGQTSLAAEEISTETTCHAASGYVLGVRPRCWFKPNLEFLALRVSSATITESSGNGNGVFEPGENIAVNLELKNDSRNQVPADIKGYVWSTAPGLTTVVGEQPYPAIQPGQRVSSAEPFVLAIGANAKCGSTVDVNLRATSTLGSVEQKKLITLGKPVTNTFGSAISGKDIPDNNAMGVESAIEVTSDDTLSSVTVDLDITHPYVGDLLVTLVAPNGQSVVIWNREGGANDNIKSSITKDFAVGSARGTWKLKVADRAGTDAGKFNSWALKAVRHVCE